ncbi:MAG: hypothetical protein JW780_05080, partial [Clostridiales bacterium]|nr:hypothetical protein [Clostridiales bacterium]
DAAVAGFLAGIVGGHPFHESVLLGCAAGALSVRAYDAVSGLIPLDDMLARIRSGWPLGKESFT